MSPGRLDDGAALNTDRAAELGTQIAEGKKTRAHPPASAHAAVARRAQDGWADRAGARAR